ncbi:MAG: diphosphomevalonate decarboxylase [Pseudomonadota bacterium]
MVDSVKRMIQAIGAKAADEVVEANAYAPSNIALAKYWGKRDLELNLPKNSSFSVSLGELGSHTHVAPGADDDVVLLNGEELQATDHFAEQVLNFVGLFRGDKHLPLRIETRNTVPTAAGLASSASGFAALISALNSALSLQLTKEQQSLCARLGSGSATRSIWHGFVRWHRGNRDDGLDSHGVPLRDRWDDFRIAVLPIDTGPKAQSSRDGMNHTVGTSPLYAAWPQQAENDCNAIETAVKDQDMARLGPLCEANALAMHATMLAARPALRYLNAHSWQALDTLGRARAEGLKAFATMDAGPNIKLIYLAESSADVQSVFADAQEINPFAQQVHLPNGFA